MYEQKKISELEKELRTDTRVGLTEQEAERRISEQGENVLARPPAKTPVTMFAEQLNDPLIYILFVASAISMFLKEYSDALIILVVITLNAIVGMIQEGKAQKALEALKKMTSPTALVKRGGSFREIPAAGLTVGDIVRLEAGCQIPADLRLSETSSLKVEESALTGESVPSEKDASFLATKKLQPGDCKNMAYMASNVVYGRGEGIVTATGMKTEIGKIAGMISETPQEATPLQKRLGELGKLLSAGAVFLCVVLFFIAVLQQKNIPEMLLTAISLAVAAVPEGLPAVVTIVLSMSVSKLVKVNTIVRRLPAVETLGSVNVVCSDKTGTLTQNRMTVLQCYTGRKLFSVKQLEWNRNERFVEGFTLCNDAYLTGKGTKTGTRGNKNADDSGSPQWPGNPVDAGEPIGIGDPTEIALVKMGADCGIDKKKLEGNKKRLDELPFDSDRKMMTTVHQEGNGRISYTKGSCDEILKRCTHILIGEREEKMGESDRREIERVMEGMSSEALRVLALAMRMDAGKAEERDLTFVGMVGMMDPPREEASGAIALFKKAGVKTVMITGDHVDTAFAIASQLDIARNVNECITGEQLDHLSDSQLEQRAKELSVFARVSPQHKVRIVKAFRANGNTVAMTGDGVNDAPSLKAADIGIAMGRNGTDVAKNASDIILSDDNFATIEKAIEEGRGIYQNIKKSVIFLLSSNFGEIITMFLAIVAGLSSPLKASHILWINLITDSLPALALGVDENDKKLLMSKPPRDAKESLFADGGLFYTLFYGALIAAVSLVAFMTLPLACLSAENLEVNLENLRAVLANQSILIRSQTYAFTVLGISELFHAIGMRNVEKSIFATNPFSNRLMVAAFVLGLLLQVSVTEIPYLVGMFETVKLSLSEWARLVGLAAMPLLAHEVLLLDIFRPFVWIKSRVMKIFSTEIS